MTTKKGIALPPEAHAEFKARADEAGTTLSAWLVAAGRQAALRQAAEAYAAVLARPEVAEQIARHRERGAPARALLAEQRRALTENAA